MRSVLPFLLAASTLSACNCSSTGAAPPPTPVTLVFTNTSSAGVFVDATDATYGLVITPQGSPVTAPPYFEVLPTACTCLSCANICGSGGCPGNVCQPEAAANPMLQLLAPDASVERQWSGVYLNPSQQTCGQIGGSQACLQQTNDTPTDTFTARVCYASSVPGGEAADAGVPFSGALPNDALVCATQDFQPEQGTVYLTPPPPVSCSDGGSCPSGQLCFSAVCTTGCPSNDFPPYGNGYVVNISSPSGPFFLQTSDGGSTVSSGTGAVTAVAYQSGTTFLSFLTDGGLFTGNINFTVPQVGTNCCYEAFHPPETLTVTLTETPPGSGNRGLVLRDVNGQLLEAVDMATPTPLLDSSDTAPFTVTPSATPAGCASVQIGCNALFAGTAFSTPGGLAPLVLPGQVVALGSSGANFVVLNVTNTSYFPTSTDQTACNGLTPLQPYLILNTRP